MHNPGMSKVKSPKEKKRLSLQKDRRNVYGECPTSSRKNIRRRKQLAHMEQRRVVKEELRAVAGPSGDVDADVVEARAKDRVAIVKHYAFKKVPDAPLAEVIQKKLKKRADQTNGRRSR